MIVVPFVENGLPSAEYPVATASWAAFPARSMSSVYLGWDQIAIHLRFEVRDTPIQALVIEDNGPVWRDRCVEWFVSFDAKNYYNIECNAIGTLLVQYGPSRHERHSLSSDRLAAIGRLSSLGRRMLPLTREPIRWSLALDIPNSFFEPEGHRITNGTKARGNFYLCGDDLSEKQYLSHYPVVSERPDFHRPESFGPILFT